MLTLNDFVSISFVDFSQFFLQWTWIFSLIPACCFTPLYNIHTKSKNFSSILRTVESILPSLWIKRRADASALPDTSARAQFDTIVLNLTNGESSIQALQEVYCNNLPFLCSFQMMGKEGLLLLDCRISMFETTTSFLKERVQTQDFFLFTTLRKLKSTPHRHCLTVEMSRLGKIQFEKKVQ